MKKLTPIAVYYSKKEVNHKLIQFLIDNQIEVYLEDRIYDKSNWTPITRGSIIYKVRKEQKEKALRILEESGLLDEANLNPNSDILINKKFNRITSIFFGSNHITLKAVVKFTLAIVVLFTLVILFKFNSRNSSQTLKNGIWEITELKIDGKLSNLENDSINFPIKKYFQDMHFPSKNVISFNSNKVTINLSNFSDENIEGNYRIVKETIFIEDSTNFNSIFNGEYKFRISKLNLILESDKLLITCKR